MGWGEQQPVSLRGKVELLLRRWEMERSAGLAAAEDGSLPDQLRAACGRAAERLGECIEDLDVLLDGHLRV